MLTETAPAAAPDLWTAAAFGTDFTLTPAPPVMNGGAVVFAVGRTVGTRVRISGATIIENTQDVVPTGKVDSGLLNIFFDRMTLRSRNCGATSVQSWCALA